MIWAAISYAYMVTGVILSGGKGLTFSTYLLWTSLAVIVTINLKAQKIDNRLVTIYAIGAGSVSLSLLCLGKSGWSSFDTIVAILVIICIIIWKVGGPRLALIAMVVAGLIAAMPFTIMTWKNPESSPVIANVGFLAANLFTYLGAKEFGDKLYSGVNTLLCGTLVAFWVCHYI